MELNYNRVHLCGQAADAPVLSHINHGCAFYRFTLSVLRLSGQADKLPVIVPKALLDAVPIGETGCLHITGELRSFNNKRGEGAKLVITVFARSIAFDEGEDINRVALTGTLCKPPNLRITPKGRDICDLMLAVNRRCGRSDYLPCICWGRRARDAALLGVGDRLSLCGRIQSRPYIKVIDGIQVDKVAFEVSVTELEPLDPW